MRRDSALQPSEMHPTTRSCVYLDQVGAQPNKDAMLKLYRVPDAAECMALIENANVVVSHDNDIGFVVLHGTTRLQPHHHE